MATDATDITACALQYASLAFLRVNIQASTVMARFLLTKRDIISQLFSFLLGIALSASPVYAAILLATVIILYLLEIFALPSVHPGDILEQAQNQISETRAWLDDEAATRHSVDMYAISVRGYQCLRRCVHYKYDLS